MPSTAFRARLLVVGSALAALALLPGCFNPFRPEIVNQRVTTTAPTPTTPQNAVKLFEWCWNNRGYDEYSELLTDDYVFQSAGVDSAGNPTREVQARRADELEIAQNMFLGTAERPPASKLELNFDRNLIPFPDTRAGKDPNWHKTIRTSVSLKVDIGDGTTYEIVGYALFYLVRGDSASIPAELKARGFQPDPLRWWIDRWEDETLPSGSPTAVRPQGGGPAALAPVQTSFGRVKDLYRVRR